MQTNANWFISNLSFTARRKFWNRKRYQPRQFLTGPYWLSRMFTHRWLIGLTFETTSQSLMVSLQNAISFSKFSILFILTKSISWLNKLERWEMLCSKRIFRTNSGIWLCPKNGSMNFLNMILFPVSNQFPKAKWDIRSILNFIIFYLLPLTIYIFK